MTLQNGKRLHWLDVARGIAILLVVFGHTMRGGSVQRIVYSFHVAAFFFLSGMTCSPRPLKEQLYKDFRRIMVPYYIFGLLSILIFAVLGRFAAGRLALEVDTSLWNNLKELFYACPKGGRMKFNMPLWFLPCLFATKLLYYGIYRLFQGKQRFVLVAALVCAALGSLCTELGIQRLPFHLSVSLKMLLFFSFGRRFFLLQENWEITGYKAFLPAVLLLGITVAVAWAAPKVNYSGDDFPNIPVFFLTALTGTFGLCFLSMGIGQCKPLEYVGMSSLAILTMHKFPVLLFQTIGPLKDALSQYGSARGLISALSVSLMAVVLCLLAKRIIERICPAVLGH